MDGISLQKVYTDVNTQGTALTSVLNHKSMMFFIGVHQSIRLRTKEGTLLTIVLAALFVYHLRHIVHPCLLYG